MATVGVLAAVYHARWWHGGRGSVERANEIEQRVAAQQQLLERAPGGGALRELLDDAAREEGLAAARRPDERQALALALARHGGERTRTRQRYTLDVNDLRWQRASGKVGRKHKLLRGPRGHR